MLHLLTTCITLLTIFHLSLGAKYIGCFKDILPPQPAAGSADTGVTRDLSGEMFLQEDMTVDFCEKSCGRMNRQYFGLQYSTECYCGDKYGKYAAVDESKCSSTCGGDKSVKCGGDLVNSVYEVDPARRVAPRELSANERPLLGLVMMVKDEAHTLPSTLLPLKPYIDFYYILDTGSTDGTQAAIRRVLGDRGVIVEEPFIDYGRSRNRALDIAQNHEHPPIFSLMLSADETVYNAASLRKFCEDNRDATGESHEAYPIVMDVGWRFDSLRLSRTDKSWRYVGRVHEYLAAPDQRWHPTIRVPDTYIKFRVTDPQRRSNREYTILRILLEEKAEKPTDTRTAFYLARTYNVIGNHTEAIKEFRRRIALGGWQEEVYESLYAIAYQLEALGKPWPEQEEAFLEAYEHSPERAEPLYGIASHYYREHKFALAYLFASHASTLPYPKQAVLWVQQAVYDWQCHFVVGMSAHRLGPHMNEVGARALLTALKAKGADSVMQDQLNKYKSQLPADVYARIEQSVNNPGAVDAATENAPHIVSPAKRTTILSNFDESSFFSFSTMSLLYLAISVLFGLTICAIVALCFFLRRGKVFRGADGQYSDKVV